MMIEDNIKNEETYQAKHFQRKFFLRDEERAAEEHAKDKLVRVMIKLGINPTIFPLWVMQDVRSWSRSKRRVADGMDYRLG